MAEKKLLVDLEVRTGQSRQNLEAIQDAAIAFGESGVKAGSLLSNGLGDIEAMAKRAFGAMDAGKTVSQSTLEAMATKFISMREEATKAFGSVEAGGPVIQKGLQIAEAQIVAVNAALVKQAERAETARDWLQKLGADGSKAVEATTAATITAADTQSKTWNQFTAERMSEYMKTEGGHAGAMKRMGAEWAVYKKTGVESAHAVAAATTTQTVPALTALERVVKNAGLAEQDLQERVETGSTRMGQALTKLVNVHNVLQQEMERERALGNQIAPETVAAYDRVGKSIDEQRVRVRKLTDQMTESRTEIKEGGEQWTGLGNAINKALGPMGEFQAKAALGFAAFKEGWQMGQKLNVMFGTDMSLWNEATAEWGGKAGILLRRLADDFVSFGTLVADALDLTAITDPEAYFAKLKTNFTDLTKTVGNHINTLVNLDDAWQKQVAASKKSAEAAKEHTAATKESSAATKEHTETSDKAAIAAAHLADEKKKLADQINAVVLSLAAEQAAQAKSADAALIAGYNLTAETGQLAYLKRSLDEATAAYAKQKAEVDALTASHGAQDPATRNAAEQLSVLSYRVQDSTQRYSESSAEVKLYGDQQKAAEAAVERSRKTTEALTTKQTELQTATGKLTTEAGGTSTALADLETKQHALVNSGAVLTTAGLAEVNALQAQIDKLKATATETGKAIEPTEKLATSTEKIATHANSAATSIGSMATAITTAADTMEAAVNRMVTSMERLDTATKKAAGGGTSSMYPEPIGPELPK